MAGTPSSIPRARLHRLAVRTASCRSRRERFGGPAGGRICVVCCVTVYVTSVLITSTVNPSKQYTRSLSRWRAGTELCADKQEEPSGKKGSMGSEKRQKSFRSDLKSVVTLLFPPRFDRAARKTRRALAASLRLSCCRAAGSSVFPEDIVEF